MSKRPSSKVVRRALKRAAADPFFLGSALEAYRSLNGLDDTALADYLGCSTGDTIRLAFCRRPVTDAMTFRREVEQIAAYASVRADRLAQLLREVDSLETLRKSATTRPGFLMAARDRVEEGPTKDGGKKRRSRNDKGQDHKP
ncbi:MAG TPA: hypothetical protein VNL15_07625 [Dehalococcoidia bacterium]|nr:hypothetical protein [Dehalococcoidia bacterium]